MLERQLEQRPERRQGRAGRAMASPTRAARRPGAVSRRRTRASRCSGSPRGVSSRARPSYSATGPPGSSPARLDRLERRLAGTLSRKKRRGPNAARAVAARRSRRSSRSRSGAFAGIALAGAGAPAVVYSVAIVAVRCRRRRHPSAAARYSHLGVHGRSSSTCSCSTRARRTRARGSTSACSRRLLRGWPGLLLRPGASRAHDGAVSAPRRSLRQLSGWRGILTRHEDENEEARHPSHRRGRALPGRLRARDAGRRRGRARLGLERLGLRLRQRRRGVSVAVRAAPAVPASAAARRSRRPRHEARRQRDRAANALKAIRDEKTPAQRRDRAHAALADRARQARRPGHLGARLGPPRQARPRPAASRGDFAAGAREGARRGPAKVQAGLDKARQDFGKDRGTATADRGDIDTVVNDIASATGVDAAKVRSALQGLRPKPRRPPRPARSRADDIRQKLATALGVTTAQLDAAFGRSARGARPVRDRARAEAEHRPAEGEGRPAGLAAGSGSAFGRRHG